MGLYKKTPLLIAFLLVSSVFAEINGNQKPEWKGKIETENGIKVIKNPREPLYGEIKIDLQEDLSIGREDDKNYLFWLLWDIAVDGQGNIYVADTKNLRVQKFDSNGKYLQTIGRGGQGPGEFQQPTRIRIDETTGKIFVCGAVETIQIFDRQGRFVKTIHMTKVIYDFRPIEDGGFIAVQFGTSDADLKSLHVLCHLNSSGEIEKIIVEAPYNLFIERTKYGVYASSSGYELDLYLSKIDSKTFVYGYSKEYELNVIDKDGNVSYRIKKDEPRPVYTSKEKEELKGSPALEYKPYFFLIFTDSKGRIYVQRNFTKTGKSTVQDHIDKEVDIFSRDGYFLYKAKLPANTCVIKDGFLYAYKVDEEAGLESVKRYKIKNWEHLKDGISEQTDDFLHDH